MIHYLFGYGCFLLGVLIYILMKAQKLRELGEANPDPRVSFGWRKFFNKEYINCIMLLLGGVALVVFAPSLVGGAMVDVKSSEGAVVTTVSMQSILDPFYFLTGLAGPSALFSLFGKYEKTLLNKIGVDPSKQL